MIQCVNTAFESEDGKSALSTGPSSVIVKEFLDGSGPPCLFVAMFTPKADPPMLVAHTGLNGRPYATAGMAEVGKVCYFIRDGKVKLDVSQDVHVLFGEFRGDPSEGISGFLQHCIKPITESIGATGKSSAAHVNGFLKSLDRLTKELDETTAAMAVSTIPLSFFVHLSSFMLRFTVKIYAHVYSFLYISHSNMDPA